MRNFFRDILLTLLLGVLIVLALPKPPEYNNNIGYKHHYITHHAADIKTLIMGHSHFENGLNPHLLGDSAFNLASAGRPFYYDIEILRQYLPKMSNVKTVLFPLRYRLSDSDFFKERFLQGLFEDYYYGWNIMPPKEYAIHFKKPARWIPHYRRYTQERLNVDSLGYVVDRTSPAHMTEIETMSLASQSEADLVVNYLGSMAEECAKHNVRLIVLAAPQSDLFLSYTTKAGTSQMDSVVACVKKNHPIEYHNYMADSALRTDTLYRDWTHLNSYGADIFTKRIKEDLGL